MLSLPTIHDGRLISDGVDRHSNFVREAELNVASAVGGAGAGLGRLAISVKAGWFWRRHMSSVPAISSSTTATQKGLWR